MKIMTVTKKIVYMIDFYHTIYMFFFCSISFNAHASLEHFLKPLEFNKKGITHFFGSTFNASEYAQDFLPIPKKLLSYGQKNTKRFFL